MRSCSDRFGSPSSPASSAWLSRWWASREEHEAPIRSLLGVFGLLERPGIFPVVWELVPPREGFAVGTPGDLRITASPNAHGSMPNMALRFEAPGRPTVVYSSDTEPC